jgi:hypothetical protein
LERKINLVEKGRHLIPKALSALNKRNYELFIQTTQFNFPDGEDPEKKLRWIEHYVNYMKTI